MALQPMGKKMNKMQSFQMPLGEEKKLHKVKSCFKIQKFFIYFTQKQSKWKRKNNSLSFQTKCRNAKH